MSVKHFIVIFIASFLFLFSCTSDESKNISVYPVTRANFEDLVLISGQTEPVNSVTLVCPNNVDGLVVFIVEDGTFVEEGEVVCIIEDVNIENSYDNQLLNLENSKAELEKLKADINLDYALLEAQVRNNEAETQIALLDSLQLDYLSPTQRRTKELQLEKTAIEKARYEKKLKALEIVQQTDLKKIELNIQRTERRVQTYKDQLDALTVKAPRAGLALRAYHHTGQKLQVGNDVWNSRPLITLPDIQQMQVKIYATENEYKRLDVNDSIMYTFDAMPDNKAWGKIQKKAPIGQALTNGSKVKYFEIIASIDSSLIVPDPGLSVNCHVYLQQLSDTIMVPNLAVFDTDSMKVVYVKQKDGFEMREVQTGISSLRNTVIPTGVTENEFVALTKPAERMIKNRKLLTKDIITTDSITLSADSIKEPACLTKIDSIK